MPEALRIVTQPVVLTQKGHIKLDSKKRNKMLQRRERQKEKKINDVESAEDSSVPRRQAQKDKRQAAAAARHRERPEGAHAPAQGRGDRGRSGPRTRSGPRACPGPAGCRGTRPRSGTRAAGRLGVSRPDGRSDAIDG